MTRLTLGLGLALFLTLGAPSRSEAKDAAPETLLGPDAVAVLAVANDKEALRKEVRRTKNDVWMLAHDLCLFGAFDEALALTGVVDERRAQGLAAQIDAHRKIGPLHEELRTLWRPLSTLTEAKKPEEVLALLKSFGESRSPLSQIRLIGQRAYAHQDAGRTKQAAELHDACAQRAWDIGWRLRARNKWQTAAVLWHRARAWEQALTSYRGALEAADALGDEKFAAGVASQVPSVLRILGRLDEMVATSRASIRRYESLDNAMMVSWMQSTLASALGMTGQLQAALASAEQALENARIANSAKCQSYALNKRGAIQRMLGRIDEAVASHEKAIRVNLRRGKARGASQDLVMSRMGLGNALTRKGDYGSALRAFEAVHELSPATSRHGQAQVLTKIGQFDKALALYELNLAEYEKLDRVDRLVITLNNMGIALSNAGEQERAVEFLERALAIKRKMNDRPGVARSLASLAVARNRMGKHDEALELAEETRALATEIGDVRTAAGALMSKNVALLRLGRKDDAIEPLMACLKLLEDVSETEYHAIAYRNLSHTQWERARFPEALRAAYEAVRYANDLVEGLGTEEGASARSENISNYANGLAAAVSMNSPKDAAFFIESARAGGLLEALEARRVLPSLLLPEKLRQSLQKAREEERAASARYTAVRSSRSRKATRAARRVHREARVRLQGVVERIQREAVSLAQVAYPTPATLQEIQESLAPGEALLLYGEAREFVCLVVEQDAARLVGLGPSNEVRKRIEALRLPDHPYVDPKAIADVRALLADSLGLKNARRILISPSGPLSLVPFSLLFPQQEIAHVDSGTTYRFLRTHSEEHAVAERSAVLGLGDPHYTAASRLQALPGTRKEVAAVAGVPLLGADATDPGMRTALSKRKRWRSLHFACHGLLDVERPMFSSLALTPTKDEDGLLTALEVFQIQVPAELVVLSACETAGGRIYAADGVVGLTRAFMHAGAPRVISSLWKVDDEATRALMIEFYRLWNPAKGKGLAPAAALQRAQEYVRSQEKWAHPVYWGAWRLSGLPD